VDVVPLTGGFRDRGVIVTLAPTGQG